MLSLSCSPRGLQSLLGHAGSLAVACELLVVSCGVFLFLFLTVPHGTWDLSSPTRLNLGLLHWEGGVFSHWTTRRDPKFVVVVVVIFNFIYVCV